MKIERFLPLTIILLLCTIDTSVSQTATTEELSLECTFSNVLWFYFNVQYTCTVRSNLKVLKADTTIVAVDGVCGPGLVISNVTIFSVLLRTVRYIPKGLDVLLPNLKGIKFENTQLKHVTKENLQPFPDLLMFSSVLNDIQYVERDLFMYNTKLQFVSFRSNKITYIDPLVFDIVSGSLVHLWMDGTVTSCGLTGVTTNANVKNTIAKLKTSACAKEENAPALYLYWLQQQQNAGNCDAQLAEKNADIDRLNMDVSTLLEENDGLSEQVKTLEAEVTMKDSECETRITTLQEEFATILACAFNPGPNCPSLDAIRSTYGVK